jgi:hypothetical protein
VDADETLRGVERNAFVVAGLLTAAALLVPPRPGMAIAVAGGALLAGASYWSLKRGVSGLVEAIAGGTDSSGKPRRFRARQTASLVLRYALLALLAYVMIARLRLHPWGLLAGASSVVAGVSVEAVRLLVKKS